EPVQLLLVGTQRISVGGDDPGEGGPVDGVEDGHSPDGSGGRFARGRPGRGSAYVPSTPECTMASVCDVCGKSPRFGMWLSHSHRRTKRRWNPNVQRIRAIVDGTPKRIHVCTSCLKAGKVQKPDRKSTRL